MLGKFKRRISRTKSTPDPTEPELDSWQSRTLSLTPSDEQIISKLSFTPETQIIERAPQKKTASLATHWSERTVFNNIDTGFLSLPTELLNVLQPYLSLGSEVALRHSCSRFFHLYSTPSFYLSGSERFDFICMTERDQDPTRLDLLVCGACRDLHPRISFPSSEVRQLPLERDCHQVWLCAHRHLGYRKTIRSIKAGVEAPFRVETLDPCSRCRDTVRNRSVADRPDKGTSQMALENSKAQSLLISKINIMQAPLPSYTTRGSGSGSGMYKEIFQAKEVSAALQAIDFRLCNHLKLGDPIILSKFCRSCINTQRLPPGVKGPVCISESKRDFGDTRSSGKCKGSCFVRGCKTKFMFQARESLSPDASGRRQVWLIIVAYRWLGPLLTEARDETWTSHAVDHKERLLMRKSWENWEKANRARQMMPNWSISLLHPEDCNLH